MNFRLITLGIAVAMSSLAFADECGTGSCRATENIRACAGLKSLSVNARCNESRGRGSFSTVYQKNLDLISCEARLPDGQTVRKSYEVNFPRCTGGGLAPCNGQSSRSRDQRATMDRYFHREFLKDVAASDQVNCNEFNQCELFLRRDVDLFAFSGAIAGDGAVTTTEAQSIQADYNRYDTYLSEKYENRLIGRNQLVAGPTSFALHPHQGFNTLSAFNVSENRDTFTFRRRFAPATVTDYDTTNRTLTIQRTATPSGKTVVITDSEGISNVELRFVGNQCFPFKRSIDPRYNASVNPPRSFDFTRCESDASLCEGARYFAQYQAAVNPAAARGNNGPRPASAVRR